MLRGLIGGPGLAKFDEFAANRRMIGFTHFGTFPLLHDVYGGIRPGQDPTDGWKNRAVEACEAWAYCFREPDLYLPPDRPRFFLSGSDFVDTDRIWRIACGEGQPPRRWDLCYSCLPNWFNDTQKNWALAKPCIERMATELGLRILLIGRAHVPDVPQLPNIDVLPKLEWSEFLRCIARSRLVFFPNVLDASPRVITEALALDVPVLVNREILGGWKYVNKETGRFFDDQHDVVQVAEECLTASTFRPREWLSANCGKDTAARKLASALREIDGGSSPETAELTYALPSDSVRA